MARISPSNNTKLRLFADSGGFCANPNCLAEIFAESEENEIHIGEMAHVISAGDKGPRAEKDMTDEQRATYENLILLCPNCHTKIDKAEEDFPVDLLIEWKTHHKETIAKAFGCTKYDSREEVRSVLEPLLDENNYIFHEYGPMNDAAFNPESEMPVHWLRKIREKIIPNNRKILILCETNRNLLKPEESRLLLAFQQHVDDFEAKHLGVVAQSGKQFPVGFNLIFSTEK